MPGDQDPVELIEMYFRKGWTDGLPVMPPSAKSVNAALAAVNLQADEVVGEIPARNLKLSADKIAINAVLAGCLPDYMPVVLAAVKGICHPDFSYHGPATSTGGAAIAIIVNGPIAGRLEINAADNAHGETQSEDAPERNIELFFVKGITEPFQSKMGDPHGRQRFLNIVRVGGLPAIAAHQLLKAFFAGGFVFTA